MAYASYEYYQGTYYGAMIRDQTEFVRAAERASEYMDTATFDRLQDGYDEYGTKVQKCCCALADAFYTYLSSVSSKTSQAPAEKTSETIGKYSVSYVDKYASISQLLSGGTSGLQDYLKSIMIRYLGNTGLLYSGCD